jgi:hypothetical protein
MEASSSYDNSKAHTRLLLLVAMMQLQQGIICSCHMTAVCCAVLANTWELHNNAPQLPMCCCQHTTAEGVFACLLACMLSQKSAAAV